MDANEINILLKLKDKVSAGMKKIRDNVTGGFDKMKKAAKLAGVAMGAAFVGVGIGLFKMGQSFQDATDTIIVATGASGEALEGLQQDFRKVFGSIPTSADDAATAIGEINTRLGLTGAPLVTTTAAACSDPVTTSRTNCSGVCWDSSQVKGSTSTASAPACPSSATRSSRVLSKVGWVPGRTISLGWGSNVIATTGIPVPAARSRARATMARWPRWTPSKTPTVTTDRGQSAGTASGPSKRCTTACPVTAQGCQVSRRAPRAGGARHRPAP